MPETISHPVAGLTQADLLALCGWHGTIASFLSVDQQVWLDVLDRHHKVILHRASDGAQGAAWRETYHILQRQPRQLVHDTAEATWWTLVFEYEFSRDFRRADLMSDPDAFLRICDRPSQGITLVILVGEGQEIYYGEEEGIVAWDRAIAAIERPVVVHCPPRLSRVFGHAAQIETNGQFDLTTSLRSHLAEDVHLWVNAFLDGEIREAHGLAKRLRAQGFALYVTGSLDAARRYVRTRYAEQRTKRYGIIVPQKASWEHSIGRWGVDNSLDAARNLRLDRWFDDPPESKYSCCRLHSAAVDFQVQGLELDFPIIL